MPIRTDRERPSAPVLLDAELAALDAELASGGAMARRMLNGRTQPTRYFSLELRQRVLEGLASDSPRVDR